eukprot:8490226-Pyramimonas_sp.AAC.1
MMRAYFVRAPVTPGKTVERNAFEKGWKRQLVTGLVSHPCNGCSVFTQSLPGTLLSDDPIDPGRLSSDQVQGFRRAEELRRAAMWAWIAMGSRSRPLRVLRARRCAPPTSAEGQFVFAWRQGR